VFTGIVEAVGRVESVEDEDGLRRIRIASPELAPHLNSGASISVDGACLTVEDGHGGSFGASIVTTTMVRTLAGRYVVGSPVNLERAARLGDRLDGHIVQGHVDGIGQVLQITKQGGTRLLDVTLPEEVARGTILHGSLTLNGVSLTVNDLRNSTCQVAIIPHTWQHTNLSALEPGDLVNVEGDLIGKYVGRIVAPHLKGL